MAAETQNAPPNQTSLRLLRHTLKSLAWLTVGGTLMIIVLYTGSILSSTSYRPSFVTFLGAICAFITVGGVMALCFLALTKIAEMWAEILDSGSYKTALLEALLTDPVDHAIEQEG